MQAAIYSVQRCASAEAAGAFRSPLHPSGMQYPFPVLTLCGTKKSNCTIISRQTGKCTAKQSRKKSDEVRERKALWSRPERKQGLSGRPCTLRTRNSYFHCWLYAEQKIKLYHHKPTNRKVHCEAVQRASAKPSGRVRRREIFLLRKKPTNLDVGSENQTKSAVAPAPFGNPNNDVLYGLSLKMCTAKQSGKKSDEVREGRFFNPQRALMCARHSRAHIPNP